VNRAIKGGTWLHDYPPLFISGFRSYNGTETVPETQGLRIARRKSMLSIALRGGRFDSQVFRGGPWPSGSAYTLRCGKRTIYDSRYRGVNYGFRIARRKS
jgi:hypothetical protein